LHDIDPYGDYDQDITADDLAMADRASRKRRPGRSGEPAARTRTRLTRPPRTERDQAFKCGRCKQFIGAPVSGGRHRNHCPNCLYSRHVDDTMPGDRKSDCHAMMRPLGLVSRRNGEQVLIHECLGCGKHDPNRIAADDNPVLLMRLVPLAPVGLAIVAGTAGTGDIDAETA
jgi:hypothetical protein